jgi:chromosome segregation ATPase
MKRKQLEELGLTDDQIEAVMKANGDDVKASLEQVDTLTAERDALKEQIKTRDTDIKELTKGAKDNEELSGKFKSLQEKYENDTKALNDQIAQAKLDSAITSALATTKARDPKDLMAFLKRDQITLKEDGSLEGLDDQVKALQTEKAYLFAGTVQTGYTPAGGQGAPQSGDLADAMKSADFNFTQFMEQQAKGDS